MIFFLSGLTIISPSSSQQHPISYRKILLPFHGCIVVIFTVWSYKSCAWGPCFTYIYIHTHRHTERKDRRKRKIALHCSVSVYCSSSHSVFMLFLDCIFGAMAKFYEHYCLHILKLEIIYLQNERELHNLCTNATILAQKFHDRIQCAHTILREK